MLPRRLPRISRLLALRWTRRGVRVIAGLNVLVLLAALAPFVLWEGLGPARFADIALGTTGGASRGGAEPDPWGARPSSDDGVTDGLPFDLAPTTRVTLVFSVGSRGLDPAEARRLRVGGLDARGADGLTDSMMLVVADRASGQVALLSIPRDLWLFDRGHRINATLNLHGLQAFVDDVSRVAGLPIHHLVQVNFGAFASLVDAVGGIPMTIDRPLADHKAKLFVPSAGCWHLDGADALAYARSRSTLTQASGGRWVTDRSASDFGRIERQQQLLRMAWDRVRSPASLRALPELVLTVRRGLVVDDGLGVQEVRNLLQAFQSVPAGRFEGYTLPTTGRRIGAAAAQVLDQGAAAEILGRLRTWPPDDDTAGSRAMAQQSGPVRTVVAAGPDPMPLAAATDACDTGSARRLPDPIESLRTVPGGSSGSGGGADGEDPTPRSSDPASESTPPSGEPTEDPPDGTTPPPGDPSPSPEPSEDDGGLLPWPI